MFLLDTNVLSELRKAPHGRCDANVLRWAKELDHGELFISVITILELERGILLKERKDAQQGKRLRAWLEQQVLPGFAGQIIEIDTAIARKCAQLHVPDQAAYHDAILAATAIEHSMPLVTRNIKDFKKMPVELINPWQPVATSCLTSL